MERDIPPKTSCDRRYEHAIPLRAGLLKYPTPGPSVLKKKGILEKTAEYLVKEAKDELTVLLKVSYEKWYDKKHIAPGVKEEKFLWTWSKETTCDIDTFFRTKAEGMCRHTRALIEKEEHVKKGHHRGVCQREECAILKTEELLLTYLTAKLSPVQRNERYFQFIEQFPVHREIVLFDPEYKLLAAGKLVAGGLFKKKFRWVKKSNGEVWFTFPLMFETDSKMEALKNVLRPLALTGMRKSTNRAFILKYLAHPDKDTLLEWSKLIGVHLKGLFQNDHEKDIKESYSKIDVELKKMTKIYPVEKKAVSQGEEKSKSKEGVTPEEIFDPAEEFLKKNKVEKFIDQRYVKDCGLQPEIITAQMESTLDFDSLFNYLVQRENELEGINQFDKHIFGSFGNERKIDKLRVIVDPTNSWGKTNEKFGADTHRAIVQAIAENSTKKSLSEAYSDAVGAAKKEDKVVSAIFTGVKSFAKEMFASKTQKQYYNLEKSYFVDYNEKGVSDFAVIWGSSKASGFEDSLDKNGASEASFDHLSVNVQRLANAGKAARVSVPVSEKETQSWNMETFQQFLFRNPGIVRKVLKSPELQKVINPKEPKAYYVWGLKQQSFEAKCERLAHYLTKDTPDEARLAVLGFCKFLLVKEKEKNSLLGNCDDVPVEVCRTIFDVARESSNVVVLKAAVQILTEFLLRISKRKHVINEAIKSLVELISAVTYSHKGSELSLEVIQLGMETIEKVMDSNEYVSTAVMDAGKKLVKLLNTLKTYANPRQQKLVSLNTLATGLERKCFYAYSVINKAVRRKEIGNIEEKLKGLRTSENREKLVEDIEAIKVPYILRAESRTGKTSSWKVAHYSVARNGFIVGETQKKLVRFYDFKDLPFPIPSEYSNYLAKTYFDSSSVAKKPLKSREEKFDFAANDAKLIVERINKLVSEDFAGSTLISVGAVVGCLRAIRTATTGMPEVPKSLITVKIKATGESFMGKKMLESIPNLRSTWATSILKQIAEGVNGRLYYDNIKKNLPRLDIGPPSLEQSLQEVRVGEHNYHNL